MARSDYHRIVEWGLDFFNDADAGDWPHHVAIYLLLLEDLERLRPRHLNLMRDGRSI